MTGHDDVTGLRLDIQAMQGPELDRLIRVVALRIGHRKTVVSQDPLVELDHPDIALAIPSAYVSPDELDVLVTVRQAERQLVNGRARDDVVDCCRSVGQGLADRLEMEHLRPNLRRPTSGHQAERPVRLAETIRILGPGHTQGNGGRVYLAEVLDLRRIDFDPGFGRDHDIASLHLGPRHLNRGDILQLVERAPPQLQPQAKQRPPDDRLLEDHADRAAQPDRRGIRDVIVPDLIAVHGGNRQGGWRGDFQLTNGRIPHVELQLRIDDQIVFLDVDNHPGGHFVRGHDRIHQQGQAVPTARVRVEERFALGDGASRSILGLDTRKGGGIDLGQAGGALHHQLQRAVGPHGQMPAGPDLSRRLDNRDLHGRWQASDGCLCEDVQAVLPFLRSAQLDTKRPGVVFHLAEGPRANGRAPHSHDAQITRHVERQRFELALGNLKVEQGVDLHEAGPHIDDRIGLAGEYEPGVGQLHLRLPPNLERQAGPEQRLHDELSLVDAAPDPQRPGQFDFEIGLAAQQPNLTDVPVGRLETRLTPGTVRHRSAANSECRLGAMNARTSPGDGIGGGVGIVIEPAPCYVRIEFLKYGIALDQDDSAGSLLCTSVEGHGHGQLRTINVAGQLDLVDLNLG